MNLFDDCNPIDCALETLDELGLNLNKVAILTRKWSGEKVGSGKVSDSLDYFTPTPRLKNINQRHENKEGGLEKRGSVILEMFSKTKYQRIDLELISELENEEKYYYINGDVYDISEVQEKLTHYNVVLTKSRKRNLNLSEE